MTSYLDKQAKMPFSLRTVENVAVAHALNLTKLVLQLNVYGFGVA